MRVYSTQGNKYNKQTNFRSWTRDVYSVQNLNRVKYRNHTSFYRDDIDWDSCIKFFMQKANEIYRDSSKIKILDSLIKKISGIFDNKQKFHIYDFACSNGSEPYTIAIELSQFGKEMEKFIMPIVAVDIDKYAINIAKNEPLPMNHEEIRTINVRTKGHFDDYFEEDKKYRNYQQTTIDTALLNQKYYRPKKVLTDSVQFKEGDVLQYNKKIKRNNSIVFARNFWAYLDRKDYVRFAKDLYNRLGNNSYLVVGSYETQHPFIDFDDIIRSAGFEYTGIKNVYTKPNKNPRKK